MPFFSEDTKKYRKDFREAVWKWLGKAEVDFQLTDESFKVDIDLKRKEYNFEFSLTNSAGFCQDQIAKAVHKIIDDSHLQNYSDEKDMFYDLSQPLRKITYIFEETDVFKEKDETTEEKLSPTILIFGDSNRNAKDLVLYKDDHKYTGFLLSKEYNIPEIVSFSEDTAFEEVISRLDSMGDFKFYLKDQKQ